MILPIACQRVVAVALSQWLIVCKRIQDGVGVRDQRVERQGAVVRDAREEQAHRIRDGQSHGRGGLVGRALDYLSFYFTSFWCLLLLLRRGDVVVAMTDPPMVSVIARWAAAVRGALLVNWVQDLVPEVAAELGVSIAKGWLGRLLIVLRDGSLHAAALNVVLSERMAEAVRARGVAASRVRVIQNWADGTGYWVRRAA